MTTRACSQVADEPGGADVLVMPIVYVTNMAPSLEFYRALGFTERQRSRSDNWVELEGKGSLLALHLSGGGKPMAGGRVELCFVATGPLEHLRDDLAAAGITSLGPVLDEAFGRAMTVTDPDGLEIQINEHDPDLYT